MYEQIDSDKRPETNNRNGGGEHILKREFCSDTFFLYFYYS